MADDEPITQQEKVRIVSDFILHSPPGEFNEVLSDVRTLLDDDNLLKDNVSGAFAQYNKDQFIPCKIEGSEEHVLITDHGDLGGGRYLDPRTKQSFKYDHLRKEASDFRPAKVDSKAESWRAALEKSFTDMVHDHYPSGGCTVYSSSSGGDISLTACVEAHNYSAKNFWNGRCRSQWSITFPEGGGTAELTGVLKNQVHYYEEGNVQLVSSKEVKFNIKVTNEVQTAKLISQEVQKAENEYQLAILENYNIMSASSLKALRRQLPPTRSLIDWPKLLTSSYMIGRELGK